MNWKIALAGLTWMALLVAVLTTWTTAPTGLHLAWIIVTAIIVRWFVVTNPGGAEL